MIVDNSATRNEKNAKSDRPKGARTLRADDTRAKLLMAASELFASKGYRQTTVDQIAKKAGVAKGTFFVHFAAKDAAVASLLRTQVKAALRERERVAAAGGNAAARMRAALVALGQMAGASRGLCRAVLAASLESEEVGGAAETFFGELHAALTEDVRAGQKDGIFDSHTEAPRLASALVATYFGAALYFSSRPSADLMELLVPLLDMHIASFSKA